MPKYIFAINIKHIIFYLLRSKHDLFTSMTSFGYDCINAASCWYLPSKENGKAIQVSIVNWKVNSEAIEWFKKWNFKNW